MDRQKLLQRLDEHKVPHKDWGQGETKTLDDLLTEIRTGECILVDYFDGRFLRFASVVMVTIYFKQDGKTLKLVEDRQVFKNGQVRRRSIGTSLSEKVSPNESLEQAMIRGFKEELGITEHLHLVQKETTLDKLVTSVSYPGLHCMYSFTTFEDILLPPHLFKADGYVEEQQDKKTFFLWKEVPTK